MEIGLFVVAILAVAIASQSTANSIHKAIRRKKYNQAES